MPADAQAVLAVCVARDVADIGRPDFTLEDVRADWETPAIDPAKDCFVAEDDDGAIIGYAVIDHRGAMVSVHPQAEGRGAGTLLRQALEARAGQRGQAYRQVIAAGNASGVAHLTAAGYERAHVHLRMRIDDLAAAPAAPPAPVTRTFDLETEGAAVHELVEEAFAEIEGNVFEPYDSWMAYVGRRSEPSLRLALDDDAGLAGVVIGERWDDDVGYVGYVAVAARARGRGFGRTLLLAAFDAFRGAGLEASELSVAGTNAPATGLYEAVGMTESWRQEVWVRSVAQKQ